MSILDTFVGMGLIKFLLVLVLITIIFSTVFVAQSNYLDTNINTDLDVLKNMGVEMAMPDDLRRRINMSIVPNLSLFSGVRMIMLEKDRLDVKHAASSLQTGAGGGAGVAPSLSSQTPPAQAAPPPPVVAVLPTAAASATTTTS